MKYNFDTLRNYALWYYFRYFPSVKKLSEKLLQKSKDEEMSKKVMESILHLTQEKQVIWDKIRLFILKNKNLHYIKNSLMQKWFEKDDIENILQNNFLEEGKSLLNEKSLKIKIENYKNAGKSIMYIKQKLIERSEDRELIEAIINELFPALDSENIEKEIEKLKTKYPKEKLVQKLLQKWFTYNDIKKYVS